MRHFDSRALALLVLLAPAAQAQTPAPEGPAVPAAAPATAAPSPAAPSPAAPSPAAPAAAPAPVAAPSPTPRRVAAEPVADVAPQPAADLPSLAGWLGGGALWVPSAGLDAFADDDALVLFSAAVALSLAGDERLNVAGVAGLDLTASDSDLRGNESSLGLMRLALGPELRGSILPPLFWHGRVAPTLTRLSVELEDASSSTLSDSHWVWGAEAALGLDFRLAEVATSAATALGVFARLEGGYAWSPGAELVLSPDGSDAPVRTQPLPIGELSLAGPTFRASVGVGL